MKASERRRRQALRHTPEFSSYLHVRIINPWRGMLGRVFGVERREFKNDHVLYHLIHSDGSPAGFVAGTEVEHV
jgi:hypothetical protein